MPGCSTQNRARLSYLWRNGHLWMPKEYHGTWPKSPPAWISDSSLAFFSANAFCGHVYPQVRWIAPPDHLRLRSPQSVFLGSWLASYLCLALYTILRPNQTFVIFHFSGPQDQLLPRPRRSLRLSVLVLTVQQDRLCREGIITVQKLTLDFP